MFSLSHLRNNRLLISIPVIQRILAFSFTLCGLLAAGCTILKPVIDTLSLIGCLLPASILLESWMNRQEPTVLYVFSRCSLKRGRTERLHPSQSDIGLIGLESNRAIKNGYADGRFLPTRLPKNDVLLIRSQE